MKNALPKKIYFIIGLFLLPIIASAKPIILRSLQTTHHFIALTFSATTYFQTFTLQNPARFIVDLKNVKTYRPLHLQHTIQKNISSFRYAQHHDGVLRLVFGLRKGITARAVSASQHQLKIVFSRKKVLLTLPAPIAPHKTAVITAPPIKKYRDVIVVIDPGHGGKDPGAIGLRGTKEKNVVLSISKKLQKDMNAKSGYRALLTRTSDYYLTLRQRLRIARHDKADIFIAIHADKWRNVTAKGVSVFALSQRGATSEAARWLATRENASELMGGVALNDKSHLLKSVLINLSQSATIRSSLKIGADILNRVKHIARLHHDRVEQAAFVVLKSPDIPSLLVETGFLSNPHEERRLKSQSYQNQLAQSLTHGITDYFSHYTPRDTWLSYWRAHPKHRA